MAHLQSRAVKLGMTVIALLWLLQNSSVKATCTKCESSRPPNDCIFRHPEPAQGGPPCSCLSKAPLRGCVLKPCENVGDELCELGMGKRSFNQSYAYSYRCNAGSDQCESCNNQPPDCTYTSYNHPPAKGGPACSCANRLTPAGCTLKPCVRGRETAEPCVCQPGINSMVCFHPTCPGNFNGGSAALLGPPPSTMAMIIMICLSSLGGYMNQ